MPTDIKKILKSVANQEWNAILSHLLDMVLPILFQDGRKCLSCILTLEG